MPLTETTALGAEAHAEEMSGFRMIDRVWHEIANGGLVRRCVCGREGMSATGWRGIGMHIAVARWHLAGVVRG